jgi:hypothetical protein
MIGFDNTAVTWGGEEWGQGYMWSDSVIWGE